MKQTRLVVNLCLAFVAVWLILGIAAGIVAAEWALHPIRRPLEKEDEVAAQAVAEQNSSDLAEVAVTADDGAILRGWSFLPHIWNGDAVVLLHGQADNRAGMLGIADLLLRRGYAVLLPDARAHGASGGTVATYGVIESSDLQRWFDLLNRTENPRCIDGLGESMGASQLLVSLGASVGFCAVVAESPFASFREASYDRLGEKLRSGAWAGRTLLRPAVEAGFLYTRWRYGIDLEKASPENAVSKSITPVLLVHGKRDTNLPSRHSEIIQAKNLTRNPAIVLWEPAQADHCGASHAEPKEFERRIVGWFKSHNILQDF